MSSPVGRLAMIVRLADSLIICCHFETILTVSCNFSIFESFVKLRKVSAMIHDSRNDYDLVLEIID